MKKLKTWVVWVLIVMGLAFSGQIIAANETEYVLNKTITSITPTFMSGRQGDLTAISGFIINFDIYYKGTLVGTGTGEISADNPPVNMTDQLTRGTLRVTNNIPGFGSYEVEAFGISLSSSTSPTQGDFVYAWAGSIENGTGKLENTFGLSAGNSVGNFFAGTGQITEVVRIRTGF